MIGLVAALMTFQATAAQDTVTDSQIGTFAAAAWDKRDRAGRIRELGIHHGTRVIVEYPCSDLCPDYTTRIIRYAVDPGPDCVRIGGVEREMTIPKGIASVRARYCVPAVLGTTPVPLGGG